MCTAMQRQIRIMTKMTYTLVTKNVENRLVFRVPPLPELLLLLFPRFFLVLPLALL